MRDQLLVELCANGRLSEYREILEAIISSIRKSNCKISCKYNDHVTSIVQSNENDGRQSHIRISLIKKREQPLHIIWEILHEYGHHLSGKRNEGDSDIDRENEAWNNAFVEMKKYFNSKVDFDSFENYKLKCLKTYQD